MSKQRQSGSNLNKRKLSKMTINPIENPENQAKLNKKSPSTTAPPWTNFANFDPVKNRVLGHGPLPWNTPSMWPAFTPPRFWSPWLAATFASASFTAAWDSGVAAGASFGPTGDFPKYFPWICYDWPRCMPPKWLVETVMVLYHG